MDSKGIKMKDNEGNKFYPCPYYPIGSIYLSVNNINPANYFGGSWEQIENVFLLACSNKYKAGSTGGEETHTLTVNEMPRHNHLMTFYSGNPGGFQSGQQVAPTNGMQRNTELAGGDQPHNNMPPYLAVYMWKRVT